jgi:uncharacterized protein (TIGR02145 family)
VGFENTVSYEAGIGYTRTQGWNPYSEFNNQFDFNPPVLTANAGARVYVKPEISVSVYGVLAGYANAEAYGEILVDLLNTPWWELYAGLDFGVGARAEIWSIELFDYETNVLELRWLLAQSEETSTGSCPGIPTVTDQRNGKVYNTVLIGDQCWLRENMDIGTKINDTQTQSDNGTIEKYCYGDNLANCNTYGGLYQWNEAMQYVNNAGAQGICPAGWHIPTMAEIQTLATTVAGDANSLKAFGQGSGEGAGTNTSGFSALLAGYRFYGGTFSSLGIEAYYWSSTEYDEQASSNLSLYYDDNLIYLGENDYKDYGFSIRCVKD